MAVADRLLRAEFKPTIRQLGLQACESPMLAGLAALSRPLPRVNAGSALMQRAHVYFCSFKHRH